MSRRRLAPWGALAAIAVCAVVAALVAGGPGLLGALIGGGVVMLFFGATPTVLGPVAKATPTLSLLFAMIFFVTKVVALLALFLVLQRSAGESGPIDPESVSVTVIATTLAWLFLRVLDATRERTPVYDLPERHDEGDSARS
ncbi:hypothetical protein [Aeromicrobium sp. 179-A 4D2 NHS]|uniref:hypothetical protein n=1 Tax=Aeromicrobium sp. 179-A 4D2 NHS TaxID=3142375 RepID=UPI0039A25764